MNHIDPKYIIGYEYVYNNCDLLMNNNNFKTFIINSEKILHKYHKIFNTNDRKEVIAKYIMLCFMIFNK